VTNPPGADESELKFEVTKVLESLRSGKINEPYRLLFRKSMPNVDHGFKKRLNFLSKYFRYQRTGASVSIAMDLPIA